MWQIIETYIGIVIMTMGIYLFARIVLNTKAKISKAKFLLLLLIISILYTIAYFYLIGTIKTLIIFLITIIFYKYSFKISNKKSIFLSFLYIVILMIPDLLELLFLTRVVGVSKSFYYNEFAGSLLGNASICVLFVLITYLLRNQLRNLIETKIDSNIRIIMFSVTINIFLLLFFYTIIKKFKIDNDIFLYLGTMVVLAIVLFSLIKQTIQNIKLTQDYDKLLAFMKTYEKEIENQKTLRHETKNSFLTIKSKIQDNQENKEIVKYIDEILKEKIEVKQEVYAKFGYLPPNGIKGLCYFKMQEAENKGIKVYLNISKRVENSIIYKLKIKDEQDFGKILGVILDNAIEASLESEEKKLGIEAYVNSEEDYKMIISNTYKNSINKEKIGRETYSTKGKDRGHGLLLVKNIINKNQKIKLKTEIQDKIYIQEIIVKNH